MIFCFGCMAMSGDDVRVVLTRFIDHIFMVHVRDAIIHADGEVDEVFPGTGQVRPDTATRCCMSLAIAARSRRNTSPGSSGNGRTRSRWPGRRGIAAPG